MIRFYTRRSTEPREKLAAAGAALAVGLGVGAVTYYLVHLFLAREPLPPLPSHRSETSPASPEESGSREAPA